MSDPEFAPATPVPARQRNRGAGVSGWLDRLQHRLHLQDLLADAGLTRGLDALRESQRRWNRWFTISAIMGFTIGISTAGLSWLVEEKLWSGAQESGLHPLWWLVIPGIGLLIARGILNLLPGPGDVTETTEAYIGMFHARTGRLRIRDLWARLLATVATVGSGGSLGLEGPAVLTGATIGSHVQARFARLFAGEEGRLLMVVGAAAGVSAVFRAPVTGLVFALEVPYKDDIARHAVLPAIVASATGYIGQAVIFGTAPLFPVQAVPGFSGVDLLATLVVGLACGVGAQAFARALRWSNQLVADWPWSRRFLLGASMVGVAGWLSASAVGHPDAIGLGYEAILRVIPAADPSTAGPYLAAWTLGMLLGLKVLAVIGTLIGGGVGGVFTPLVLMGATSGSLATRGLSQLFPSLDTALFPLVGMAAFLGAGYHVPLAAVVFVAETTGSANYIVAGLLAAAVAFGTMGRLSVSHRQRSARRGRIEQLLDVPVSTAIASEPITMEPTRTVESFVNDIVVRYRHREYPVTIEGRLVGIVALEHVGNIESSQWATQTVADIMEHDPPSLGRNESLTRAAELMAETGRSRIPIVDDLGRVIGMVGPGDVFRLGEILEDISRSRA
ncbi:MAG: CIC family chloride channel protein [Glaciecola sp.]|jgi:CIC family chloride channel protein